MSTDEKFNKLYEKIVNENKDDMEKARDEARAENEIKWYNFGIVAIIVVIGIVIFFNLVKLVAEDIISADTYYTLRLIILVILVIVGSKLCRKYDKSKIEKYKSDFKTKIIGAMIKSFEENLEIIPDSRIIF